MDTIGGYTLVRRLGSGSRADVHLGRVVADRDPAGPSEGADAAAPRSVAVKLFRAETTTASIGMEAEALARTASPHLLSLTDLALDEDGRVALILPRLRTTSLASLLLARAHLAPGEIVTILAPLAAAVVELHRVGVAHGGIRCSRVLFDSSGAPVLIGFGGAAILGPSPGSRASTSLTPVLSAGSREFARDLEEFTALARTVIESADASAASGILAPAGTLGPAGEATTSDAWLRILQERLFSWASPLPVDLEAENPSSGGIPARVGVLRRSSPVSEGPVPIEPVTRERGRRARAAPDRRVPLGIDALLPEWVTALLTERQGARQPALPASRNGVFDAIRGFLAPVRRRVWWTAGAVAVMLVAGLVLIPEPAGERAEARTIDGSEAAERGPSSNTEDEGDTDPDPSAETSPPPDATATAGSDAILGDDPVAAAEELLHARATCLADDSVECLLAIDQPESAAMDADEFIVTEGADDPLAGLDVDSAVPTLVQRLGDSALLDISLTPLDPAGSDASARGTAVAASALLVKGSAGWRIRDLIVGGGAP